MLFSRTTSDNNASGSLNTDVLNAQIEENKNQIFDNLAVCDSRVPEYCARAGQPAPYLVLQVCFIYLILNFINN